MARFASNLFRPGLALASLTLPLLLGGCGGSRTCCATVTPAPVVVPAEIEIEVYDPVTGGIWIDACVRVVESYQEWSNQTYLTGNPGLIFKTDVNGLAYLSPIDLADAAVGFPIDAAGQALLGIDFDEDEADVRLEISGAGFPTIFVDVTVCYDAPYQFLSIPWEPLTP